MDRADNRESTTPYVSLQVENESMRGQQTKRQWALMQALSSGKPRTLGELCRLLRAERRTLYRDLKLLKEIFPTIGTQREGHNVRYFLAKSATSDVTLLRQNKTEETSK